MKLTREEELRIARVVDGHQFTISTLRDDILDHLCCVVEHKVYSDGIAFEEALRQALNELAPDGLSALEEETFFLINSTKILSMKKITFLIGLISAMSIGMGWTFKILHWRFGTELSIYGLIIFALVFLPMLGINHYKFAIKAALSERLRIVFGYASGIVLGSSILFKFLHLQGADLLLLSGGILFSVGFLPFLFFNMYKKSLSRP